MRASEMGTKNLDPQDIVNIELLDFDKKNREINDFTNRLSSGNNPADSKYITTCIDYFINVGCLVMDIMHFCYHIENTDKYIVDKVIQKSLQNSRKMFQAVLDVKEARLLELNNKYDEKYVLEQNEQGIVRDTSRLSDYRKIFDKKLITTIQREVEIIMGYCNVLFEKENDKKVRCQLILTNILTGLINANVFLQKIPIKSEIMNDTQLELRLNIFVTDIVRSWSSQVVVFNQFVFDELCQNQNIIREYCAEQKVEITTETLLKNVAEFNIFRKWLGVNVWGSKA
ncbi:hypothetical protein TPHA_0J03190 [Tetrapisispora phaffii CBS 4417]|uniref:Uncharacterized protein n=1 Tax=Tetrapisispora phaffii (strain ATCC 24235 / CBS 4417 / NBRC 1672 / NRRL Y-8282 / UCD 70-5) TaxID=1071381 RepID=G8BY87_TETPH|nr:hypothetical protein TPHA_0J03190 [Tetrapisispora phaffii CBS 4417]CCE65138.1 hypothetical protein TPHA_0J03190 [Tetrapisispora phaffii CBS 4417]